MSLAVSARAAGVAAVLAATSLAAPANAHHSYAPFDRDLAATVVGAVESVDWVNPHVIVRLRTSEGVSYSVIWESLQQLERNGVADNPLSVGDEVAFTGAPRRDDEPQLSVITRVERPADGWSWSRPGLQPAGAAAPGR